MLYWNPHGSRRVRAARRCRRRDAQRRIRRCAGATASSSSMLENSRGVRDAAGRIVGYEGTLTDITERKRAEQAIFAEKERAQVTLQSIGDAVISTDARRPHRLHESGRRKPHRLDAGRGARPADRRRAASHRRDRRASRSRIRCCARWVAARTRRTPRSITPCSSRAPARSSRSRSPRRRSATAQGRHDRRRHRVPRRDQGAAPEARAVLPGEPRRAHRPHQPPRVRQSPACGRAARAARRGRSTCCCTSTSTSSRS